MSRAQLRALGALSLLVTIAIVGDGAGASGQDRALRAALAKQLEVTVTLPPGPPPAAAPAPTPVATTTASDDGDAAAAVGAAEPAGAERPSTPAKPASTTARGDATAGADELPATHVKHVFVVALAGHGLDATFGPGSAAPYLAGELRPKGALLTNHRSLGRSALADRIALIGGQPPNADTRAGCPVYREIAPSTKPSKAGEIATGGCVYPNTVATVADQLTAAGKTWRAYIEDLDRGPVPAKSCRRPASNAADDTTTARPGDGYATRHNPFVYFHSLIDLGGCDASDLPLTGLEADLATAATTPNYVFVAPNLCNDGTESPCVDGTPGGLAAADAFLAAWVPKILAAPAYRDDGVLLVTFTGSAVPGAADAPARNGTLLLSRFATAGATIDAEYDPYSLLRSVEDLFGLRPLARAAKAASFVDTALPGARVKRPGDD